MLATKLSTQADLSGQPFRLLGNGSAEAMWLHGVTTSHPVPQLWESPHSAIQGIGYQTNTGHHSSSNTKTSWPPEKESVTVSLCLSPGQTSYPNSFPEPGSWLSLNQWVGIISRNPL